MIYATDASAYRETPVAVVYPKDKDDIRQIVLYAAENGITLIPRAGGTSLAGQVVGNGIVVDVSKYMNHILEINADEHWVRVEPGVILDELNQYCKPFGLFFGPETSTSNRCCMGGMVGNNSCGSHSLVYGSTRDHVVELNAIMSDGSEVVFKELSTEELENKSKQNDFEGKVYSGIIAMLSDKDNQNEINSNFPDAELKRRNSGYAIDDLLHTKYFEPSSDKNINLCKLLTGSEGTLAFTTEIKLHLEPLPPKEKAVICIHCNSLAESFTANLVVLQHKPVAVELMDGTILELSKDNITQSKNRFFVEGDPPAILIAELAENDVATLDKKADDIINDLKAHGYGYHYPIVRGNDINRVWALRKAGLGLLSTMPGSAKPVSVIEDTAVLPKYLPEYVKDIQAMLDKYGLKCVYHAHISTGELHLRPILNLKEESDRILFRKVGDETAHIVKKYKGSLSGEHGDGRLRGEFIPLMFGEKNYQLFQQMKGLWDPKNIFNKGKIVDTPPMDTCLRYENKDLDIKTYFDYSKQKGWLCAIEQCNGTAECRKSNLTGGTMCPSYRATRNEQNSTRARANVLRELLLHSNDKDRFNQPAILEALDTCVSCKACKAECPSNVDMTRYKAEYMQHHYDKTGIPLRPYMVANISFFQKLGSAVPYLYNFMATNPFTSGCIKKIIKFSPRRAIPKVYKQTLRAWIKGHPQNISDKKGSLYLFADEFTNYLDVEIGITFVKLMNKLGYEVKLPKHVESGRAAMSKGMLKKARKDAEKNVTLLAGLINNDMPLVGIEPSCILSFRDEYPDLVNDDLKKQAALLSKNALLYDEFIVREMRKGNITKEQFTNATLNIKLHGHCHQKALASVDRSREMLSLPENYHVDVIPSGCCGMAGSFGYEKEHYDLSMAIGEMVLFPTIREAASDTVIAAPGTSCRQQINDGTGRKAYHPVEVLYNALT